MYHIFNVHWNATNIPSAFPSHSSTFRSLSNLHLQFLFPASQHRNHNSSSRSNQDDLTTTITVQEISFLDGRNSISAGNSISIDRVLRSVAINYHIAGDAFFAPISGGNIGGRNNVNTSSYSHIHILIFSMFSI